MNATHNAATAAVEKVRIGSMFSGVGGLDLAVEALWPDTELVWLCEHDDGASAVLAERFPGVPNHGDVAATDWTQVEPVDVVCGGFPCQDISHAGKRAGIKEGTRSGLWFDMLRAVRDLAPRLLLLENVAAIASAGGGLDVVLGSLAEAGWDAEWACLRASDVGAPHGRDRWFAVCWPAGDTDGMARSPTVASRGRLGEVDEPGPVERAVGPDCAPLLPTPRSSDGPKGGPGQVNGRGVPDSLPAIASLLPTPTSRDWKDGKPNENVPTNALLGREVWLLPTPRATRGGSSTETQNLLPTPVATDSAGARNRTSTRSDPDSKHHSGTTLNDVAYDASWGEYEPAIRRWEDILGRPAPAPTDDEGRLSPEFTEWMMGWPDGWTYIEGTSRSARLKRCGNGVVTLQAWWAYIHLLDRLAEAVDNESAA